MATYNPYPGNAGVLPGPVQRPRIPLKPAVPQSLTFGSYFGDLTKSLPQIKQLLAGLGLGAPVTPYTPQTSDQLGAQAQALIQAQIAPLIAQINASIASRSQQGSAAIQQYTGQLAGLEGQYAPTMGAAYDKATSDLHALETGLADRLGGAGKASAKEVTAALAQAGQDTTAAQGLAGVGKRAGNASAAKGGASEAALIASRAADQVYGAKLPGIVGLIGSQQGKDFQSSLNNELSQLLGGVQSQVPSLVAQTLQSLQAQDLAKQQDYTAQKQGAGTNLLNLWQTLTGGYQAQQNAVATNATNQAKIKEAAAIAGIGAADKKTQQDRSYALQMARLKESIAHNQAIERNASASLAERQRASQQRIAQQAQAKQLSDTKAAQTAQQKATSTVIRMATASAKKSVTYGPTPKLNAFGQPILGPDGKPVMVRTAIGQKTGTDYYKAIHQIEAAVTPTLSPYMGQGDIIRFVQQIVNQYYGPGVAGRPSDVSTKAPGPSATKSIVGTGAP